MSEAANEPTATLEVVIDETHLSVIREIVAHANVSYWMTDLQDIMTTIPIERDAVVFRILEEDEDTFVEVTVGALSGALVKMTTGRWTSKAGMQQGVDPYQMRAAVDALIDPTDVDYDALTGDYLIQLAAFGELVYS